MYLAKGTLLHLPFSPIFIFGWQYKANQESKHVYMLVQYQEHTTQLGIITSSNDRSICFMIETAYKVIINSEKKSHVIFHF